MEIIFYEKPGCINNTKQKALLDKKGYKIQAKSILTEPWTRETLRPFFGNMPLKKWFNPTAPRIKNGELDPASFTKSGAIEEMIKDPYLIRRPLLEIKGHRICGFDHPMVKALIEPQDIASVLTCPQVSNTCD